MGEGMVPLVCQRRLLDVSLSPVHSVVTPLLYPGGKSVLSAHVARLVDASGCRDMFVEPYVAKGASLYASAFDEARHRALSDVLAEYRDGVWMLTYDDAPLVRGLYAGCPGGFYRLRYSVARHCAARELMVYSPALAACRKEGGLWS